MNLGQFAEYYGPLSAIVAERQAQDRQWGEQNHALPVWITVLTEEVGELAQVILQARAGEQGLTCGLWDDARTEAIQVAAVAVAIVEYLDRHREDPQL